MQETQVRSPGQEDCLEEEIATLSTILAWKKSYRQRSLVGYRPNGHKELDVAERLNTHVLDISVALSLQIQQVQVK